MVTLCKLGYGDLFLSLQKVHRCRCTCFHLIILERCRCTCFRLNHRSYVYVMGKVPQVDCCIDHRYNYTATNPAPSSYTDVNKYASGSFIVSDFLATLYKNEQTHTAYLCKCWTRLENDFYLAGRWCVNRMTLYGYNVDMTALFINHF